MPSFSKVLSDVFFGTEQSKYAAIAYFITIVVICFAVLFASSDVPIEQRLLVILFILIITVPSVLFSLFELTCIVTGGNRTSRWWCYWLAWFLSIMLIIYCLFIIISLFFSMASYDMAVSRIEEEEKNNKVSKEEANEYAKEIMKQYDEDKQNNNMPMQATQATLPMQATQATLPHQPMQPEQSMQLKPVMSNDFSNGMFGYDKDDNFAPISNEPTIGEAFTPVIKQKFSNVGNVREPYLNSNSVPASQATVPEAFAMEDNLQPY